MRNGRIGLGLCSGIALAVSTLAGSNLLTAPAHSQVAPAASLEDQFRDPPNSARPQVWWHWMNGNITKGGIAKDMAWMKRVGIGGLQNFDANLRTPQIVKDRLVYMTPGWKDAFKFTASEADRLGLELAIAASPRPARSDWAGSRQVRWRCSQALPRSLHRDVQGRLRRAAWRARRARDPDRLDRSRRGQLDAQDDRPVQAAARLRSGAVVPRADRGADRHPRAERCVPQRLPPHACRSDSQRTLWHGHQSRAREWPAGLWRGARRSPPLARRRHEHALVRRRADGGNVDSHPRRRTQADLRRRHQRRSLGGAYLRPEPRRGRIADRFDEPVELRAERSAPGDRSRIRHRRQPSGDPHLGPPAGR